MADTFDPYREALIMETSTVWGEDFDELNGDEKTRIATALHAAPDACSSIEYLRMHTGFCRQINVTEEDVDRVR